MPSPQRRKGRKRAKAAVEPAKSDRELAKSEDSEQDSEDSEQDSEDSEQDSEDSEQDSEDSKASGKKEPDDPGPRALSADPEVPFLGSRCNILMFSFLLFCAVCFIVWVVSAGKRYREEHAQATEGWRVGTVRQVELTVVRADKQGLACSSNKDFWGLRCSNDQDLSETGPSQETLQPFNTVKNQLLLGAGLWNSPGLPEPLPARRFTVVCNFNIKGVVKSARIRFSPKARFAPLKASAMAGTFTDCVVPR